MNLKTLYEDRKSTLKALYGDVKAVGQDYDDIAEQVKKLETENLLLRGTDKAVHTRKKLNPARKQLETVSRVYREWKDRLPHVPDILENLANLAFEAKGMDDSYQRRVEEIKRKVEEKSERYAITDVVRYFEGISEYELKVQVWARFYYYVFNMDLQDDLNIVTMAQGLTGRNAAGMAVLALHAKESFFSLNSLLNNVDQLFDHAVIQLKKFKEIRGFSRWDKPEIYYNITGIKAWLCYHEYEDEMISDFDLVEKYVLPCLGEIKEEDKERYIRNWVNRLDKLEYHMLSSKNLDEYV